MTQIDLDLFGADPAIIQWTIVRGDTSPLRVYFYEADGVTAIDTSTWEFAASAYDYKNDVTDELQVVAHAGYVDVTALPDITQYWGTGYKTIVSQLGFDLQVTIGDVVWTPVLGTIKVLADFTGGSL